MPGINYTLGMQTTGFDAGVKGALGKLASISTKIAAITAGAGLAAGAGITAVIAKSIGKAADLETLETAFIPLLGGIQQAKDRIAELAQFAAATPFELPEIANASKTLETLTRGALSTGRGLTLVGDLASATNQPFSDLATVVGRLYDGLQSGRPVGEVLKRLQELGAVTGETRATLEAMSASGAGAEAWELAERSLSRFSGSMRLQSGTWNGLMSTFRDTISMVMAEFGKPIMDSLKPYLEGATARIESFKATAVQIGAQIGDALGVLQEAFASGQTFALAGNALKVGFMEAINFLTKALQSTAAAFSTAMENSGFLISIKATFQGIGDLLVSKIKAGAADLADAFGRSGAARDLRAGSAADALRSDNYFTQARAGMAMFSPEEDMARFMETFRASMAALPDSMGVQEARKEFAALAQPLREAAAAAKQEREEKLKSIVAQVTSPSAPTEPASAAAAAMARSGTSTSGPSPDRLAQIGGYVGSVARSVQDKAADATAKATQRSAALLEQILRRNSLETPATF